MDKYLWINDKVGQFTRGVMRAYVQSEGTKDEMSMEWCFRYIQKEIEKIEEEAKKLFDND